AYKARLDSTPSIGLLVTKTSDANVVETAKRVKAALEAERRDLPPGMDAKTASDATVFIEASLSETRRDLLLGILATSAVLFLFLRKWRSSLIVLVAIPSSLVATFFMMYMSGFTLNILSVMALALCIGILVDDSIVVLENIHRHRGLGEDPLRAAISGRTEIGLAAIAITLCDVVVFAPVAFMGDIVGQFFRQFGLTVVFASLFSLLVSFTLTPAMASRFLESPSREGMPDEGGRPRGRLNGLFEVRIKAAYRRLLEWSLSHRWRVVGLVAALFASSLALIPLGLIQTEFMPPFDQGKLVIDLRLGAGSELRSTEAAVGLVEAQLRGMDEVADVFSQIGTSTGGTGSANLVVRLKERGLRKKTQAALAKELRVWAAGLPSLSASVSEPAIVAQTSIEGKKALILNVSGPDRAVLARIADGIEAALRSIPGAVDVENSIDSRHTTIGVGLDRLALSEYGLSASDAALALRTALAGTKAGVYRKAGSEYDIVVRLRPDQMRKPGDIGDLRLLGRTGAMVPIDQVAALHREDSASSLERRNRSNVVTIQANLEGRPLGAVTAELRSRLAALPMPSGYGYAFAGDVSNMSSSFGSLAWALAASIGLVYLILLALYESYLTPAIRMLSLPAGIIGGLGALALSGKAINIVSFIGIIMLDGLISKNGTLLIDYTHTLMRRGLQLREALLEAATTRLRPILMTSFTMIAGMLPLALSGGSSSEIKSGMAIVLIGGLSTSTLISPLLLPVAYTLIDDARQRRRAEAPGDDGGPK
ncbi:MAG TPA: efflux RND transporter permease subunit, partial [Rectinemataceae bacterium]|nr:efflux RND transporter permease subunit [Rectinemataceae bacterium]